jgi:hypothetical protein
MFSRPFTQGQRDREPVFKVFFFFVLINNRQWKSPRNLMILHVICYHQSCVESVIFVLIFVFIDILHLNLFSASGSYLHDSLDEEINKLNVCHEDVDINKFVVETENSFPFSLWLLEVGFGISGFVIIEGMLYCLKKNTKKVL